MVNVNNKTGLEQISLIHELDWAVDNLEQSVKKARCIADTMVNEFYTCIEPETEQEESNIIFGYKYACIEHSIINDYLIKMQDDIDALTEIIDKIPTVSQERNDRK